MPNMYNSFDEIESYKFSFGQYKGKSLEDIKDKDDCVEYLKQYRKKIKKELKNPKAKKFEQYNKRGLSEVEDYLISIGLNIEVTNLDECIEDEQNVKDLNEEENVDIDNLNFNELILLLEEKILNHFDEKFQSTKFIRKEYKDFLCLRYCGLTYIELLEKNNKDFIKKVIIHL